VVLSSSLPCAGASYKANGRAGAAEALSHETLTDEGDLAAKRNSLPVQSASISGDGGDDPCSRVGFLASNGAALALGCAMLVFVGAMGFGADGMDALSSICLLGLGLCVTRPLKVSRRCPPPLSSCCL